MITTISPRETRGRTVSTSICWRGTHRKSHAFKSVDIPKHAAKKSVHEAPRRSNTRDFCLLFFFVVSSRCGRLSGRRALSYARASLSGPCIYIYIHYAIWNMECETASACVARVRVRARASTTAYEGTGDGGGRPGRHRSSVLSARKRVRRRAGPRRGGGGNGGQGRPNGDGNPACVRASLFSLSRLSRRAHRTTAATP